MENSTPGKETFSTSAQHHLIMHTLIIGAGWAGLAAGVELSQNKHKVTLLEAARTAGGRARTVSYNDIQLDNGQHLLIGAYQQTLRLLNTIGVNETSVFERRSLEFIMRSHTAAVKDVHLRAANLPAPLHMLVGLLTATGLSYRERWHALRLCAALPRLTIPYQEDMSVTALLQRYRQSPHLIDQLWQPLCLAIMNTPANIASAAIFVRVLNDAFLHNRHNSDFLIPRCPLGELIPQPAVDTIRQRGGQVHFSSKVKKLLFHTTTLSEQERPRIKAVILDNGEIIAADQFIIATPPHVCQRLLAPHHLFKQTVQQLSKLDCAPICTLYLFYPEHIATDIPMTGMTGTTGQWLFDRRFCGQPGVMAVVISGHGSHESLDNDTLTAIIKAELKQLFPHWPNPQRSLVIREKRATFVCHHKVHPHRPGARTHADNVWLAGDYTDTGLPATLEGAVRSGIRCAEHILSMP